MFLGPFRKKRKLTYPSTYHDILVNLYFRHIMEHLDGKINKPESEMTEEELQFHYFKLHDYDNNNKLDGIEIINAMTHYHKGNINYFICNRIEVRN